jgi:hypothetical protein
MQPDDLHGRLRTAIEARLKVAREATPGPWSRYGNLGFQVFTEAPYDDPDYEPPAVTHGSDREADAVHIALHDPDDAIRRYTADLKVLERHKPGYPGTDPEYGIHVERTEGGIYVEVRDAEPIPAYYCEHCDEFQLCDEIRDLAAVYPEVTKLS